MPATAHWTVVDVHASTQPEIWSVSVNTNPPVVGEDVDEVGLLTELDDMVVYPHKSDVGLK